MQKELQECNLFPPESSEVRGLQLLGMVQVARPKLSRGHVMAEQMLSWMSCSVSIALMVWLAFNIYFHMCSDKPQQRVLVDEIDVAKRYNIPYRSTRNPHEMALHRAEMAEKLRRLRSLPVAGKAQ